MQLRTTKKNLTPGICKSQLLGLGWTLKLQAGGGAVVPAMLLPMIKYRHEHLSLKERKTKKKTQKGIFLITDVKWFKKASSHMK